MNRCQFLLVLWIIIFASRCASNSVSEDTPEVLFQDAEETLKDQHYAIAIEKFRQIKNRYPYSSKAIEAELRIADAYFMEESFLEAESAYEIFKELHPTYAHIDYVQFRIGLSFFKLIPENAAVDLSAAHKAIEAFTAFTLAFPSSQFFEEAKKHILEARKKLAEHQKYVADFYYDRKHYLSATYGYMSLVDEYSDLGFSELSLLRLGECYLEIQNFEKAEESLEKFMSLFPTSEYKDQAQSLLDRLKTIQQKNSKS